jgi:hypothetical protein
MSASNTLERTWQIIDDRTGLVISTHATRERAALEASVMNDDLWQVEGSPSAFRVVSG